MEHQIHFEKKFYQDLVTGYWISTTEPRIRAHVWVWEYFNGKRPNGFHIHHIDENKSNNEISNLELKEIGRHLKDHITIERREKMRKHASNIRPLTKTWHASPEGRLWHKNHGKDFGNFAFRTLVCNVCAVSYQTKKLSISCFCSNKCRAAARRNSKIDDIELKCFVCQKNFTKNKYEKSKTCSRLCGGILRSKKYRAGRD